MAPLVIMAGCSLSRQAWRACGVPPCNSGTCSTRSPAQIPPAILLGSLPLVGVNPRRRRGAARVTPRPTCLSLRKFKIATVANPGYGRRQHHLEESAPHPRPVDPLRVPLLLHDRDALVERLVSHVSANTPTTRRSTTTRVRSWCNRRRRSPPAGWPRTCFRPTRSWPAGLPARLRKEQASRRVPRSQLPSRTPHHRHRWAALQ